MSKRRNEDGQMRREEYEAREAREDDTVVGYGIVRASQEEISKRRIVAPKSKRVAVAKPAETASSSNPFAGFTGLTQSASANPFSGFTGLTNPSTTPAAPAPVQSTKVATKAPETTPVVAVKPVQNKLNLDWVKTKTAGQSRDEALASCMSVLNKEFFAFVSQQVVENPMTYWSSAVHDYIQHAEAIENKINELHNVKPKGTTFSAPSASKSAASDNETKTNSSSTSSSFSFGVASSSPAKTTGFNFGAPVSSNSSSPVKTSGIAFGATSKTDEAKASTTGFSFGGASTASPSKPASSGFSFGKSTTTSTTSSPAKPASTGFSFGATTSSPSKPTSTGFSFGTTTSSPAKPTPSSPSKPASTGFSFGTTTSSPGKPTPSSPAKPASTGFSFGAATSSPAKPTTTTGKPPLSTPPKSTGFNFGSAPSTTPATSSFGQAPPAFSFGGSSTTTPATSGFSFNLPAKTTTATAATNDEEEDEENIGREEATVIIKSTSESDEDVIFEAEAVRIRQFKKEEKRWADLGSHPFKVLQNKTTKAARILCRNSIGKVMINAALYKGLKVNVTPNKKAITLVLIQDGVLQNMHLGIAADRVEQLKSAIEGATPQ